MTAILPLDLQARFLQLILPHVEQHAWIVFRDLRCRARKADAIAECVALAWKWTHRLFQQGKDPARFRTTLASFAAKAVKCGRRLARMERPKDVLSPRAQHLHGFRVESLPISTRTAHENLFSPHGQKRLDAFEERLRDNSQTPVVDQVQFRIDFPAWLRTLTGRERRMIHAMVRNERTKDLARTFEVSPGRISQIRRDLHQDWHRFCGDDSAQPATI